MDIRVSILSTPKPWLGEMENIQTNALNSWKELGCEIILFGDDKGVAEAAEKHKVLNIPDIEKNKHGTPLISSVFKKANQFASGDILFYVNADIIVFSEIKDAIRFCAPKFEKFLMVGQRWNAEINEEIEFHSKWDKDLKQKMRKKKPESKRSRDFFIFSKGVYKEVPPFAIGRGRWDSWLIGEALLQKTPVIDISRVTKVVHQNHNFNHLPFENKIKRGSWASKGPEGKQNRSLVPKKHPANTILRTTHQLLYVKHGIIGIEKKDVKD
jgi:hypothetical protein